MAQDNTKERKKKDRPEVSPAVIALVEGLRDDQIIDLLVREYNLSKKQASEAVDRAREKIVLASSSNIRDEIGLAKVQLEDIYKKAMDDGQLKVALSARVERNKLLNLYSADDLSIITGALQDEKEATLRSQLEPLVDHLSLIQKPASEIPIEEQVRLLVAYIWEHL